MGFKKKEFEGFCLFLCSIFFCSKKTKIKYLKLSARYTTWVLNRSTCEDYLSGNKKDDTEYMINDFEINQYQRASKSVLDSAKLPLWIFIITIILSRFFEEIILNFSLSLSICCACFGASLSFWSIMFQFYNNPQNGFESSLNRKMHEMISYFLAIIGMPLAILGALLSGVK